MAKLILRVTCFNIKNDVVGRALDFASGSLTVSSGRLLGGKSFCLSGLTFLL